MDDALPEDDPFIEATLAAAVDRFAGVAPPPLLRRIREFLGDVLATHPVGALLLERARPRAIPEQSGDQAKHGAGAPEQKAGGDR